jgi:hypothetical protein
LFALAAARVWKKLDETTDDQVRRPLLRLVRLLSKRRVPEKSEDIPDAELQEIRSARERARLAAANFESAFEAGLAETSETIRRVADDPRFQQAVLLQNPTAMRQVQHSLQSSAGGRKKKDRQNEAFISSYLQRYCMKNDTVGFFGPVGWARFSESGTAVTAKPGPGLVKTSAIYFEHWCIEALAERLSENKALRPWFFPRCLPFFYLEGTRLYMPGGTSTTVSPAQANVLICCDGTRTAKQICYELANRQGSGFKTETEVFTNNTCCSCR